ncbi:GNAT family N-acetyltransferase [Penaeicola halotolerans]|uniref:GNAT family N-acetyltransferase n=1 Tax=Penaeicola halotolerans TaxID=2793196 RepID=UPI001CF8B3FC|nr:GNAT family N-acetyltransferase [Penaeicola halotolerans]
MSNAQIKFFIADTDEIKNLAVWLKSHFPTMEKTYIGEKGFKTYIDNFKEKNLLDRRKKGFEICCAKIEGEIVGFCEYNSNQIHLFFVAPKYQNQGIGSMMLEQQVKSLNQNGVYNKVIIESPPQAYDFFKKKHFIPTAPELERDGMIFKPMELHFG